MANTIASNIFKQLIYYPESSLGVQSAEPTTALAPTGSYTITGAVGSDEITLGFSSSGTYTIPSGTTIKTAAGDVYTILIPNDSTLTGSGSSAVVNIDRPLKAALSAVAITPSFAAGVYSPKTLRRVSSNLDLKKETFSSNEIRSDQQIADQRTGANTVDGTISGELSSYTYDDFFGALLRRKFTTGYEQTSTVTISTVTASTIPGTTGNTGADLLWTSTDATSFGNLKTGDIVVFTGFTTSTYINDIPLLILNKDTSTKKLTVTAATNPEALNTGTGFVTYTTPQSTVKFEVLGKKTYIPLTGHDKQISFTFEHYYKDISDAQTSATTPISELFYGVRPTQASVRMPSSGIATCDFTFMGIGAKKPSDISTKVDLTTTLTWSKTTSMLEQMTGEVPITSGIDSMYTAAVGSIYIRDKKTNGTVSKVGLITSLDLTINGNGSTLKVIGSTSSPDVALGKVQISGNMSIYFTDAKFRDMFLNEDEASIIAVFTENADNSINNSFMSFVMPRIKTGGATKDDADSIVMSVPFTALVGDGTNGFEATTLSIQDYSQLA